MFSFFKKGLERVGGAIRGALAKLTDRPDPQSLAELEEVLLGCDLGPVATGWVLKELENKPKGGQELGVVAREALKGRLVGMDRPFSVAREGLTSVLVVGINGAGKTTSVAKLAHYLKASGQNPLIGSADTFRAAANEQLALWAQRANVGLVESKMGADPAAVAFDALTAARARGNDWLLLDTAGRLTTKESLMAELSKIEKVMKKIDPQAPQERLLVLDGSLGLNSLAQAEAFTQIVGLTGVIVTKLDGSAKAGFLVPLYEKLKLPVYFVGLGEGLEDLKPFDLEGYLEGLFA